MLSKVRAVSPSFTACSIHSAGSRIGSECHECFGGLVENVANVLKYADESIAYINESATLTDEAIKVVGFLAKLQAIKSSHALRATGADLDVEDLSQSQSYLVPSGKDIGNVGECHTLRQKRMTRFW